MTSVQLIVTGKLEEQTLHLFLENLLKAWSFPQICAVEWLPTIRRSGFTSNQLKPHLPAEVTRETNSIALFQAALETLSQRRNQPDFVFIVDDLEVANHHQPCVVLEHAREAVRWLLRQETPQMQARFRKSVSFHLLHLMVENYLLSSPALTSTLGLQPHTGTGTLDPEFLEDMITPQWLNHCAEQDIEKSNLRVPFPFWRESLHTKNWLIEQVKQGGARVIYNEVRHGGPALAQLTSADLWKSPDHCPWLSALFHDLTDACGVTMPTGFAEAPSSLTWPHQKHLAKPASLVLRNL